MPLNVRQRSFARLAAEGLKLTEAHEKAYGKGNGGKRKTKHEEASKLAAKPEVKAAIAEYEAQLVPIGDLQVCKQRMLANLQALALYAKDEKVRLAATINMREYIEAREQYDRDRRSVTIDGLIREIGQLQAPAAAPEMELEEVTDEEAATDAQEQAAEQQQATDAAAEEAQEREGDHGED